MIATTSKMASVGRRDRVASDAEEKTLIPMACRVSRPRFVGSAVLSPEDVGVVPTSPVIRPWRGLFHGSHGTS